MNEVHSPPEPTFTDLARGIVNDIGDLFRQEVRFARAEIKSDLSKTREAGTVLALGVGTAALGTILFALMLVHLLHWLSLQTGTDPSSIPLWGCFGIVSAVFLAMGTALLVTGYKMFQSFTLLPEKTAQTVKENVEWIVNSK
jgi:hypothetical protein